MKYARVYHMLVCHGHSPQKAGEMIVNCTRGDQWSLRWVRRAHAMVPMHLWIARRQPWRNR